MNARAKTVTAAQAQEVVDRENDLIGLGVLTRPVWLDEKRQGWVRRIIVERANEDLPRQPEGASEHNEINEGIKSERYRTY